MLSPTSLAATSISPTDWLRPVRAASPAGGPTQGSYQRAAPVSPMPLALPGGGGQQDGGTPSRMMPRGSLLDLSV